MKFEILNTVENAVNDIALFYYNLNNNPLNAWAQIDESPTPKTQRRIKAKLAVLEQHTLSHDDVGGWLLFARIIPLEHDLIDRLPRELSEAGEDKEARTTRLRSFDIQLSSLLKEANLFEKVTLSHFVEQMDIAIGEWSEIFKLTQGFVSQIRQVVGRYRAVIEPYVQPPILSVDLTSRQAKGRTKLTEAEAAILIVSLKDEKIISDSLTNTNIADCFGPLMGFQPEQLRQSLSGNNREKKQYDSLLSELEKLIKRLIEDRDKL